MRFSRTASMLASLLTCLALATPAYAELNAYMRIKAQKQGDIQGSVTQKGREGSIMVIAVDHEIVSPRDAQSGLATGKRMHKPFVITKEIDKSTPLLRNALASNETLTTVTVQFWTPQMSGATGAGGEKQHFTVTLKNASIASIHHVMPNNKNPELMKYAAYEEVAFTYQSIEWTWTDGGIKASDDWGGGVRSDASSSSAEGSAAPAMKPALAPRMRNVIEPR